MDEKNIYQIADTIREELQVLSQCAADSDFNQAAIHFDNIMKLTSDIKSYAEKNQWHWWGFMSRNTAQAVSVIN